jgi:hypothetical protein
MALTSWTEYHESLLKNERWVEKLKQQSEATLGFVNNPEGLMTTVAEAKKMEEDLERIILLLPGKSKTIRVIHSCCFAGERKIWGIYGTQDITSPMVGTPGQKAREKMISMESYPLMEGFLNVKMVEEISALAGEKPGVKMVLPFLFAVPPDLLVVVFDEPEMRVDVAAIGVIRAFHDSASDKVDVPDVLLAFLWAVSSGIDPPNLPSDGGGK